MRPRAARTNSEGKQPEAEWLIPLGRFQLGTFGQDTIL